MFPVPSEICFGSEEESERLVCVALREMAFECLEDATQRYGTILSGALFGAAWWLWLDAVVHSAFLGVTVPAIAYIPGCIATVALLMINFIHREELNDYDPFSDGEDCGVRTWLFFSYVVSFGSLVGAVWIMVEDFSTNPDLTSDEKWPGVAGIIQTFLILGSGLLFWVSRSSQSGSGGLLY